MRRRADLLAHIQNINSQRNLPEFRRKISYKVNRAGVLDQFRDPEIKKRAVYYMLKREQAFDMKKFLGS